MSTCVGCLLKSTQKCSNLVKELKRLSNYIKSYGQNRLQPIFLCIFEHFPCKQKSANWCTKMASDQKKSFSKMFLKFNFTAKYFWGRLIMCILHISRNLTEPYYTWHQGLWWAQGRNSWENPNTLASSSWKLQSRRWISICIGCWHCGGPST